MPPYPLSPAQRARWERLLGQPIVHAESIQRGYTPALRLRAYLPGGRSAFLKLATDSLTAGWLRQEYAVYAALEAPFLPRCLGWDAGDDSPDDFPVLMLEDLSTADWPPPWTPARIEQVLEGLSALAQLTLPGLAAMDCDEFLSNGWAAVAADPRPFLALGLVSAGWLEQALPALLAASQAEPLRGDRLMHGDVRSDNICFVGQRMCLIDWNWASLGNPAFDLASWLPSLEAEGGPPPEALMPDAPAYAALLSGFFAARAGQPIIPTAPRVREVQRQQLGTALPWAMRALGLPPLDGPLRSDNHE